MPVGNILKRTASRFPEKTALIYGAGRLTYRELNERVNRLSDSFLKRGLKKGDRIAVLMHNSAEFFEIYFASAKMGAIFVPINNLLKETELKRILNYIEPQIMVLDPDYGPIMDTLRHELKTVRHFICAKGSVPFLSTPYSEWVENGSPLEPDAGVTDDDVMTIFLTSGTTGLPKGAMRTHRQNVMNAMSCAIELNLRNDDKTLLVFPFYHVTFEDINRHVLMANTMVIRREGHFDPEEVLDMIARERITVCQFVPTMINAMLQIADVDRYDLNEFRLLIYTASPMPVELLTRAMRKFKCQFMQLYGQTESGPGISALQPEDHVLEGTAIQKARLASAGRPYLGCEIRIVDKEGTEVPRGEVGEIIVQTEAMTIGYWKLPHETERTIIDGWLYTGDFGRMDEEGYVYIVDRKHDMIISGGKNIYPREIEELLYKHEAVLEAAVIGVPDEHWGESVKALVVLKEGMKATEGEIIDFCKRQLASYKKPRSVEFKKELPKNPTGKILKRVIRADYWKGQKRSV